MYMNVNMVTQHVYYMYCTGGGGGGGGILHVDTCMKLQVPIFAYFTCLCGTHMHMYTCILVLKLMYIYVLSHLGERK